MKTKGTKGRKVLIIIAAIILCVILALCAVFFSIYFSANLNKTALAAEKARIKICDSMGRELSPDLLYRYVKYDEIGTNIVNAFVALEDKRFFNHHGVDFYRTAGAMVHNLKSGYYKEGGSTITQQLAKNTMLNNDKNIKRKIKEMKLARDIEKNYAKEEILEMYLNAIYYGNGIYGIDSACKNYFEKKPADLTVAESAILAGIVKSPQKYSPINNSAKAEERMKLVVRLMYEQGFIKESEFDNAATYSYHAPIKTDEDRSKPYFAAAIDEACRLTGKTEKELIQSPVTIFTYYDTSAQGILHTAFRSGEFDFEMENGDKAFFSALLGDNESGGLKAYYSNKQFNIEDFRRQPGSAIKPLAVYAPALEQNKITAADIVVDEKISIDGYSPSNYRGVYLGKTDVETALKNSVNTVAVKLYSELNRERCLNSLKQCGLSLEKSDQNLSLALGGMTKGVTFPELAEAYMTLANGGEHKKCTFIKEIKNADGHTVYRHKGETERVFREDTSYILTDMLMETAKDGTAKKLGSLPFETAAKTGTVSSRDGGNSDAWCLSYNPTNTLCVWYGGEDNSAEHEIATTGGGMPALLSAFIHRSIPPKNKTFIVPETVVELEIDTYAREIEDKIYLANPLTPSEYRKSYCFSVKNMPKDYSPYFGEDSFDLEAEMRTDGVYLQWKINPLYSYKLYRENLFDSDKTLLHEFQASVAHDILANMISTNFCDINIENLSAYTYYYEIYFNGKLLGKSFNATVLT